MAAKNQPAVYVANEDFVAEIDGVVYPVHKDKTRVAAGHVLLKDGREKLFRPVSDYVHYDVEDASADPGRKR